MSNIEFTPEERERFTAIGGVGTLPGMLINYAITQMQTGALSSEAGRRFIAEIERFHAMLNQGDEHPRAWSITIQIVGALQHEEPIGSKLTDLMNRVSQALDEVFPDFLPASPAVTIQTAELRDDWIRYPKESRVSSE